VVIRPEFHTSHHGDDEMTIDELIEYLEDYREEIGGDAEVRLMTQQNWPMECTICGLASRAEIDEKIEDDAETDGASEDETKGDAEPVLYIVEGRQLGYGSKHAWDVAG
jgi:hypothetical protein